MNTINPIQILFFGLLSFCMSFGQLHAQEEYTDHKPQYRKWQDSYILDKIDYTKNSTIFYFRFVCRSGQGISAIFYPPGGDFPWYLKAKGVNRNYDLKAIKNIRRNNELMASNLKQKAEYPSLDGFGYTVFSCEVHFDRLPNDVKTVDLIEGYGQEGNQNHFNCFDIALKTWNDKELGNNKDSEKNINQFEEKFGVNTKPKVKPEPKVDPPVIKADPPKPKVEDPPVAKVDPPKPKPEPVVVKNDPPKPKKDVNNPYPIPRVQTKEDIKCGERLVLDNLEFQDNTADFKGMVQCQASLMNLYTYMRDNPTSTVTIIGHTDVFGPVERNIELSKQRAYKVQRWLSMMGINPHRIEMEWHGPKQPLKPEGSPINRRIEIKVSCS